MKSPNKLKNIILSAEGNSSFGKNIFTLISATLLAQIINFAFSVFLTRIYTPAAFGAFSIFSSIVSFILVISCGKFDVALVVAPDREDAKGLFSAGAWLTLITSCLALAAAWLIYVIPVHFYNGNEVRNWFYFVPVAIVLLSLFQLFWMWNVREKRFRNISFIRPLEALINNSVCIVMKGYAATGLLLGALAGQFVSAVLIAGITLKKDGSGLFVSHFKRLKTLAVKYGEFPRINILQGFIDTVQLSLLVLIASLYFSGAEIGYYALCMRVLQVPVRLIVLPFSHVFFAEASEAYREGNDLHRLVKRVTYRIGLYTIALPIILITAGSVLFKIIFGAEWQTAGLYAGILSPWIFFDMIRAPIVQVSSIVGKQKQILALSFLSGIILIFTTVLSIIFHARFYQMLICVSATQSLMNGFIIFVIFKMADKSRTSNNLK